MTAAPTTSAYALAVRRALSDLPAGTIAELLDDLEDHLAEVSADGADLVDALGPPEHYAAELRASAGLPPPRPFAPPSAAPPPSRQRREITVSGLTVARVALVLVGILSLWFAALVADTASVVVALIVAIVLAVVLWLVRRAGLASPTANTISIVVSALALIVAAGAATSMNGDSTVVFTGPAPTMLSVKPFGQTFTMLDLRGVPASEAEGIALRLGLQPVVFGARGTENDVVIEQDPAPGVEVTFGQSVLLRVGPVGVVTLPTSTIAATTLATPPATGASTPPTNVALTTTAPPPTSAAPPVTSAP